MVFESQPFDLLEREFLLLSSRPRGVSVDGALLGGEYLGRAMSLVEVREALLRRATRYDTRDRVLAELVTRARVGEPWRTGIAGVLLPGLRAIVRPVSRSHPRYEDELQSEALIGFFGALGSVRLERGRIAASLLWSARRAADKALAQELRDPCGPRLADDGARLRAPESHLVDDETGEIRERPCDDAETGHRVGAAVDGHPELVLLAATRVGVLSAFEADVIGATRVAKVPARDFAAAAGSSLGSVRLKRYRAERRLSAWLAAQQ